MKTFHVTQTDGVVAQRWSYSVRELDSILSTGACLYGVLCSPVTCMSFLRDLWFPPTLQRSTDLQDNWLGINVKLCLLVLDFPHPDWPFTLSHDPQSLKKVTSAPFASRKAVCPVSPLTRALQSRRHPCQTFLQLLA